MPYRNCTPQPCTSLARRVIILQLSDTTACAGELATRENASGILLLAGSPRAFGDRRCYRGVVVLATMFYLRAKKVAVMSTRGRAGDSRRPPANVEGHPPGRCRLPRRRHLGARRRVTLVHQSRSDSYRFTFDGWCTPKESLGNLLRKFILRGSWNNPIDDVIIFVWYK